jgi:hypothetical protein
MMEMYLQLPLQEQWIPGPETIVLMEVLINQALISPLQCSWNL